MQNNFNSMLKISQVRRIWLQNISVTISLKKILHNLLPKKKPLLKGKRYPKLKCTTSASSYKQTNHACSSWLQLDQVPTKTQRMATTPLTTTSTDRFRVMTSHHPKRIQYLIPRALLCKLQIPRGSICILSEVGRKPSSFPIDAALKVKKQDLVSLPMAMTMRMIQIHIYTQRTQRTQSKQYLRTNSWSKIETSKRYR